MLVVSCVGKIVSAPVQEGKLFACRLAVELKANPLVKLIHFREDDLVNGQLVFVVGKLSQIADIHLQIESLFVCPVNKPSRVAMMALGNAAYLEHRQLDNGRKLASFQLSSYNKRANTEKGETKYTRVRSTTSHPLADYVEGKRIGALGTLKTNTYESKKYNKDMLSLELMARELEITERSSSNGNGSTKTSSSNNKDFFSTDSQAKDNTPLGDDEFSSNIPF